MLREERKNMIYQVEPSKEIAAFFDGWEETMIYSCLQGIMGSLIADNPDKPTAAMACLADFCFLAGKPNEELILSILEICDRNYLYIVPQNNEWGRMIKQCYGINAKKQIRYAFKKEPDVFDPAYLKRLADSLPDGYTMRFMDEEWFCKCQQYEWSRDFVFQYENYALYQKYGLGVIALFGEELAAGASSYTSYQNGIEIEIATQKTHRRKGLATACGAKLILECQKRGWYPSWDACNLWSAALAKKLGYHFDYEYIVYEITK